MSRTLAFVNRKLPVPAFTWNGSALTTSSVRLTYTGGPFTASSLSVAPLNSKSAFKGWSFGMTSATDRGNLRGTFRTLDQAENVQQVCFYMRQYLPKRFAGIQLKGLTAALEGVGGGEPCYASFFKSTLRVIIDAARDLPQRMQTHGLDSIPILPQLVAGQEATECRLPRAVCQSLLANMFLCTFPPEGGKGGARCVADREDMPMRTFLALLECGGQPKEVIQHE